MRCTRCGEEKPPESFYRHKARKTGRQAHCKTCDNQRRREYRENNREADREYQTRYHRQWRQSLRENHPRKYHLRNARQRRARRIREAGAEGTHTEDEWRKVKAAAEWRCLACGKKRKLTRDHVIPISKGGTDYIDNIQPLCGPCNSSKGVNVIDYR